MGRVLADLMSPSSSGFTNGVTIIIARVSFFDFIEVYQHTKLATIDWKIFSVLFCVQ